MARIGVMGCGVVACYGHLPAIVATPDLELQAVFEPDPVRRAEVAQRFAPRHACADEAAFFASGLDAVVVTSPAPCHRANVLAAIAAGLPVLCEKPLAMDEAEALEMAGAAKRAGVPLFTAFDYRFSPVAQTIRQLVAAKAIGETRLLRLVYTWDCHGRWLRDRPGHELNHRRDGRMREGGPLVDCGVHQIDLARWWTGSEVVRSRSFGTWVDTYAAPDHLWLNMDHANGAATVVEMSYSYGMTAKQPIREFTYTLIGTDGVIRYDTVTKRFELHTPAGLDLLPYAPEKNFAGMYTTFAAVLAGGPADALPSADDGIIATRLARGATEAVMASRLPTT